MKERSPSESGGADKRVIPVWDRLGIDTEDERHLMVSYISQRILRYEIYRKSNILSFLVTTLGRLPIINKRIERVSMEKQGMEEGLLKFEKDTSEFIDAHYVTTGQRKRARTIELAISDIFARTVYEHPHNPFDFKFDTAADLESWGNYWREQLKQVADG